MQIQSVRPVLLALVATLVVPWLSGAADQGASTGLTRTEMEEFLRTAEVQETERLSTGFTGAHLATLAKGGLTHDAQIQTVDIYKRELKIGGRTIRNFRDSYRYNIAAYELDKLLNLEMVPVSVLRVYKGKKAAFTWWVDDVMMTEAERMAKNVTPPDPPSWNPQIHRVRVFTQLIYDTDPNLGNLLITNDWRLWKVDLTRSFRIYKDLMDESKLLELDDEFSEALQTLELEEMKTAMGKNLSGPEIKALLARRDRIIQFFE